MLCTACGRPLSFIRRGLTVGEQVLCPDCFAEVPPQGEMERLARYYESLSSEKLLAILEKGTARHRVYALKAVRDELRRRGGSESDRAQVLFSSLPNVEYLEPLIEKQQESEPGSAGIEDEQTGVAGVVPERPATRPEPFLTTESTLGETVSERLSIVSAEAAVNMRGIRDFLVGTLKSGEARSLASLDELQDAKHSVLSALKQKAREAGADGVVGITLRYEQLGAGINMLLIVATGTAVRSGRAGGDHSETTSVSDSVESITVPVYRFEPGADDSSDDALL